MLNIRKQFSKPEGRLGWLIGHLMAFKNRERSEWVLSLLDARASDHILEIGFGSGADIRRLSRLAGQVSGVDHSAEMLEMAAKRNATAIGAGRVHLHQAPANALPFASATFDKAYSINVAQFFKDPAAIFREYRRVLKPGALLAIAVQPRSKGATEQTAGETGEKLRHALADAGFEHVTLHRKPMRPVSTVCAIGYTPVRP
ncbi:MAG: class I SAM-dependent methyltransferase [Bryobacteraceae bacterium]|nr:class I SAM-dependent methyltransferase [Bryobacteraceae bacterium]